MTKLFIMQYCRWLGNTEDILKRKIYVASCSPGFVATDMTKDLTSKAELNVDEGCVCP